MRARDSLSVNVPNVLLLLFVMVVFTPRSDAGQKLSLRVSPTVTFAPANLTVRTMIEADAENRFVTIALESLELYRSSEITLDGERAPRTTTLMFRGLPTGTYEVKATLLGPDGQHRAVARQQVDIIATPRGESARQP
jgi:hypothetical protein